MEGNATRHPPPLKEPRMTPLSILTQIPLWVFPVFLGLLVIGARASHERSAPVLLIHALPLIGLLTLHRAQEMGEAAVAALALGWLAGAALGWALQPRWTIARDARRVRLRGEWVTLASVMILFFSSFALGMAEGIAPGSTASNGLALAFGLGAGAVSGSLAGRALRVAFWPMEPSA